MILQERFRYVDDLVEQKWEKELMGNTTPVTFTALLSGRTILP